MIPLLRSATDGLDEAGWRQVSDATDAFEAVWRVAPPPDLQDFVSAELGALRRVVLIELIKLDLDYRWRRGERRLIETYLSDWPELRQRDDDVLELLSAECHVRLGTVNFATSAELQTRFPALAARGDLDRLTPPQAEISSHHLSQVETQVENDASKPRRRVHPSDSERLENSQDTASSSSAEARERLGQAQGREGRAASERRFGEYVLRETLGAGGMGSVYLAYDSRLEREVALKVAHPHLLLDPVSRERFLREARAAAGISHPHVCHVFEVGQVDDTPFMALEFIAGQPLSKFAERQPVATHVAAEIIAKLADALAAIHAKGILHRDISAANVMLRSPTDPVLTDFGLARDLIDGQQLTASGSFLGTPAYSSPEVVTGGVTVADQRSDIYSLGVLLFQLLTGRLPFIGPMTRVLVQIENSAPPAPRSLRPDLDEVLESLCLKALAKDPAARFQSAAEFAAALEPFTRSSHAPREESRTSIDTPKTTATNEPPVVAASCQLAAESPQAGSLWLRTGRRRPTTSAIAVGVLGFVLLCGGIIITIKNRDGTTTKLELSGDVQQIDVTQNGKQLGSIPVNPNAKEKSTDKAQPSRSVPPPDAASLIERGQPLSAHALVSRPESIPGLRSWSIELAAPHTGLITVAIAAHPKGDLIATGNEFGKICLWDTNGQLQRVLLGHEGHIFSLNFSPDGEWLASGEQNTMSDGQSTVRLWHVATGQQVAVIPVTGWGWRVMFSPDSQRLAVASNTLLVFDRTTGQSQTIRKIVSYTVAWSPNGKQFVSVDATNRLSLWDAKTLKVVREVECDGMYNLAWSPDGRWLALKSGTREVPGRLVIRHADTLELVRTLDMTNVIDHSHSLAWLPDSRRVAVVREGAPSGIFDTTTGEQLAKFDVGAFQPQAIALRDNGREVVIQSSDRLYFFDTAMGKKLREGRGFGSTGCSALSANGREVISTEWWFGGIAINDAETGALHQTIAIPTLEIDFPIIQPAPKRDLLAIFNFYGKPEVSVVDSSTRKILHKLAHGSSNVSGVAWSPDGQFLATGASDHRVRIWNAASGKIEHELAGHTGRPWSLAWSPDGTRLATAAEDKTVRLWDTKAGELVATIDQFPEPLLVDFNRPSKLAWSNERRLWIGLTHHLTLLNVETGEFSPLENFSNGNTIASLAMSPDGQHLLISELYRWTLLRGGDVTDRRLLGQHLGGFAGIPQRWHPDSRRFLAHEYGYGTLGYDTEREQRLGTLFPIIFTYPPGTDTSTWKPHWLCLGPTGHYRGGPHNTTDFSSADNTAKSLATLEDLIVFVAQHEDGSQHTYTPKQFAEKFGWKNDPTKATLLKLDDEK